MCGLIGYFSEKAVDNSKFENALSKISHRGPDHHSYEQHHYKNKCVGIGHTRLSIIDLSEDANQPFQSKCKRYSLVFNGEIYNYKELRKELISLGEVFITESDTEVLLYAWIHWREKGLKRLIGMFAFVIFDHIEGTMTCVRDAFGIKPFFYHHDGESFFFASELPALLELSTIKRKVNFQKSYDYLVHSDYESNEQTFIDGVYHLLPGQLIEFDLSKTDPNVTKKAWWQPSFSKKANSLSFDEAKFKLKELFVDSVKLHLRSDVKVGAALSGGVDSSAVVCAMRYLEPEMQINAFSYISDDKRLSEEAWVDVINREMCTTPYKVRASSEDLANELDKMLLCQGEPFGSTSIYAQYRVFQCAREKGVKVTLDGQGADELLAGYLGYPGQRLLSLIEQGKILESLRFAKNWSKNSGKSYSLSWQYLARIKLPDFLYAITRKKMGRNFAPPWLKLKSLKKKGLRLTENRYKLTRDYKGLRVKEALVNALTGRGLPGLLRHGDRNSMAFSIESRVPFLTIPLAEFLLSLPEEYLISDDGTTKYIFREAMRGIVPDSHLDRKDKIGFETPQSDWLLSMNHVIKKWIDEAPEISFINKDVILHEFDEVVEGKRPFDQRVWRWVNYLRWYSLIGAES